MSNDLIRALEAIERAASIPAGSHAEEIELRQAIYQRAHAALELHAARLKDNAARNDSHSHVCAVAPFGSSVMLRDGTKVRLNRGENAHNAHVWLSVEAVAKVHAAEVKD